MIETAAQPEDWPGHWPVDKIIHSLGEDGYALVPDFLDMPEVGRLRAVLLHRQQEGRFRQAGIGHKSEYHRTKSIRGDHIFWIEPEEAQTPTQHYLEKIALLIRMLNRHAYLALQDAEMHFALYPAGTFYKRHLDQFQNNANRRISCICYLNESWKTDDGGQLRIYLPREGKEEMVDVLPQGGQLVLLRSELLEHEVLTAHRDRYSITGWLLDKPKKLAFLNF